MILVWYFIKHIMWFLVATVAGYALVALVPFAAWLVLFRWLDRGYWGGVAAGSGATATVWLLTTHGPYVLRDPVMLIFGLHWLVQKERRRTRLAAAILRRP